MPRIIGFKKWGLETNEDGHRTYNVTFHVKADNPAQGPYVILNTPGLPRPGNAWSYGTDYDPWAFCLFETKTTPILDSEKNVDWDVEFKYSTKNPRKCQDDSVKDPLLEPAKVSGSYKSKAEEAFLDRFDLPIVSSSHEQFRGKHVEFLVTKPHVIIEKNYPTLDTVLLNSAKDCVNDSVLWGMPPRTIRLATYSWERKWHGRCYIYYTVKLEFEADIRTFDRDLVDEGTKVLHGRWGRDGSWTLVNINGKPPNPYNPEHFDRFKDRNGENCRVILNGAGLPAGAIITAENNFFVASHTGLFNQGDALTDSNFWTPVVGPINPVVWKSTTNYVRGNLVLVTPNVYVALEDNFNHNPALNALSGKWRNLQVPAVTNKGIYSASTNYDRGDYVTPATKVGAGFRHLEFYDEFNFLLLGIPLVL